jgi:uncharacterized pyridoxamine 5'-phosphate oxidase family protein
MVDEGEEEWPRTDLGSDKEAWAWAMDRFDEKTVVPLATGTEGGPRVRPVTTVVHEEQVYVLTGTRDAKMDHLRSDPRFEFYVLVEEGDDTGYVRFSGSAVIVENPALKQEVGDASGFAWKYFEGPEDEDYSLLWMDIDRAEVMRPGVKGYELLSR